MMKNSSGRLLCVEAGVTAMELPAVDAVRVVRDRFRAGAVRALAEDLRQHHAGHRRARHEVTVQAPRTNLAREPFFFSP